MKIILFLFLLNSQIGFTQNDLDSSLHVNIEYVDFPDVEARFPGDSTAFFVYLSKELMEAQRDESWPTTYNGPIYFQFIVLANGSIANIQIVRGDNSTINNIIIDLLENMPDWIPANIDEKPVNSRIFSHISINNCH
ncbi:MAG: hypothetical protein QNK23_06085 [Crocinitomicaceae bacterium]|nr:hypothetical protein [Crocinitomicaceae bacterium]